MQGSVCKGPCERVHVQGAVYKGPCALCGKAARGGMQAIQNVYAHAYIVIYNLILLYTVIYNLILLYI